MNIVQEYIKKLKEKRKRKEKTTIKSINKIE